ncbi:hypothetical protein EDB19DRAFT_189090 [Suillus lakei]|nr:hypothetical protein EDB19DRAFT_189090 [Suillus lakei]
MYVAHLLTFLFTVTWIYSRLMLHDVQPPTDCQQAVLTTHKTVSSATHHLNPHSLVHRRRGALSPSSCTSRLPPLLSPPPHFSA